MRDSQRAEDNTYVEVQFLGKGAYAEVYKVLKGNKFYANKKISAYRLKDNRFGDNIQREIKIMKQINHDRIIKLIDVVQNENYLNIVLQYAPGGSLYDQIQKVGKIPEHQAKSYIRDVIEALEFLHNRPSPILHRDLKPQNLLIDQQGRCKLADFGSSNILWNSSSRYSYQGTKQYMAPEVQDHQAQSQAIDIWSMGILIYQLLTGSAPQENIKFPLYLSRTAQDVIKKLLQRDPAHRITLTQLKNHIWLYETQQIKPKQITPIKQKSTKIQFVKKRKNQLYEQFNKQSNKHNDKNIEEKQVKDEQIKAIVLKNIQNIKKKWNLKLIKEINQLKIKEKLRINQQIEEQIKIQQDRWEEKRKQYQKNIQLLKNSPTKLFYQVQDLFTKLKLKLEALKKYSFSLPQRTQAKILQVPQINVTAPFVPQSEYIPKIKLQFLHYHRNALIQLRSISKIYKQLIDLSASQQLTQ